MDDPTPPPASGPDAASPAPPGRWRTEAVSLALQLLVVFVGVYAAFALESYRQSQQERANGEQLRDLLVSEVENVAVGMDMQLSSFDSIYVAPFENRVQGGRPVPIPYYQINGDLSSPELQAVVSRGLGDESSEVLPALRYYNQSIQYYGKISDQLRAFSVETVAPNLGGGPGAFYESSGALKTTFHPYVALIHQQRGSMAEVVAAAERVATALRREAE